MVVFMFLVALLKSYSLRRLSLLRCQIAKCACLVVELSDVHVVCQRHISDLRTDLTAAYQRHDHDRRTAFAGR